MSRGGSTEAEARKMRVRCLTEVLVAVLVYYISHRVLPLKGVLNQKYIDKKNWKIFRNLEDFKIFKRFSDLWKVFRFLEDFQVC